jgi:hypothetical protein
MSTTIPRAVLKNAELEKTLVNDGIVTSDFLNAAELLELKEIVKGLLQKGDSDDVYVKTTFLVTTFNNSSSFKTAIFEQINAFLAEKLASFLDNYEPLAINIFDKNPDVGNGSVDIHQNPTFVQEPEFRSVSLWIPLQDVNINNGTLSVLKGSHEVLGRMRAGNMPDDICSLIAKSFQEDWCEPIEIKGGQVAILDDSIIHWSYPNKSQGNRAAVQLVCIPKESTPILYHYVETEKEAKLDMYEADKNFYIDYTSRHPPIGLKQIGSVPFKYKPFTEKEIIEKVAPRNAAFAGKVAAKRLPWWRKLFA